MAAIKLLRLGSSGEAVADIQRRLKKLNYSVTDKEGFFGQNTEANVKQFQQDRGLLVEGVVDDETWQDLVEASYSLGSRTIYLKNPFLRGDDVKKIQLWLRTLGFNPGPIDGVYGNQTQNALKDFQNNVGLKNDGIISTETIEAFINLKTVLKRYANIEFPEHEIDFHSSLASIEKEKILLDLGHGGSDTGAEGPSGLEEADVCEDIALRVGNLFKMLGTDVLYTRKPGQGRSTARRIDFINRSKAALVLSIHMNHSQNPKAEGSSCYYFSAGKITSVKGEKIANYLHQEQIDALGLKDCRVHGKNFNILRLTKIPAVIIEPAFITNPAEESLLKDLQFRQKIATAVFDGLKRYFEEVR